jgi:hypothetical protein
MNTRTIESLEDAVEYFLGSEPRKVKYNEARNLRKHILGNRVAGHGDYGIVHDPCPVHLTKYDKPELWQEGIDWQ